MNTTDHDAHYRTALLACPKGEGWRCHARRPEGFTEREGDRFAAILFDTIWQFTWATPEPMLTKWMTAHQSAAPARR